MIKQRILTPLLGTIMQCLVDVQQRGEQIVSVSPHYNVNRLLTGYIVIVNETEESQRKALADA